MGITTIVTMEIEPAVFELIESGVKQYELRSESFKVADAIRYVDSETGKVLGMFWLGPEDVISRVHDQVLMTIAAVDAETFYRLYPRDSSEPAGNQHLYVAPILERTTLDYVLEKDLKKET